MEIIIPWLKKNWLNVITFLVLLNTFLNIAKEPGGMMIIFLTILVIITFNFLTRVLKLDRSDPIPWYGLPVFWLGLPTIGVLIYVFIVYT